MSSLATYKEKVINEIAQKEGHDIEHIDELNSQWEKLQQELKALQEAEKKLKALKASIPANDSFFYKVFNRKKYLQNNEAKNDCLTQLSDITASITRIQRELYALEYDI